MTTTGYPQVINVGTAPNDGTGDPTRVAFGKTNANFSDVYADLQNLETSIANLSTALTQANPTAALNAALQSLQQANAQYVQTLQSATSASVTAANNAATLARAAQVSGLQARPGDTPSAFTLAGYAGVPSSFADLPAAKVQSTAYGNGAVLATGDALSPKTAYWLEPGAFFALRVVLERFVDPTVFVGTDIQLFIVWMDANFVQLGSPQLAKDFYNLRATQGRQIFTCRVPSSTGDPLNLVPPAGAAFWRPLISVSGVNGSTLVESMVVSDVTNTGIYSPDLSKIKAQLLICETILLNGTAAGFLTRSPPYKVANLPPNNAQNPGSRAFATDGRTQDATGNTQLPGKGTGVEVQDNGVAWVIIGTSTKVQA